MLLLDYQSISLDVEKKYQSAFMLKKSTNEIRPVLLQTALTR